MLNSRKSVKNVWSTFLNVSLRRGTVLQRLSKEHALVVDAVDLHADHEGGVTVSGVAWNDQFSIRSYLTPFCFIFYLKNWNIGTFVLLWLLCQVCLKRIRYL